jgi:hypothetical protein
MFVLTLTKLMQFTICRKEKWVFLTLGGGGGGQGGRVCTAYFDSYGIS